MNVACAVLCFNVYTLDRLEEFHTTLRTISEPGFPVFVVDNGSTDPTQDLVARLGGWRNPGPNQTIGEGMNCAIGAALSVKPDLVVFSNDDMRWHPGWAQELLAFWQEAPQDIGICGGLLERKVWTWNTPRATLQVGGVRVLQRDTIPAGAWTFRASQWLDIGPIPSQDNCWTDVPTCHKLTGQGLRLVCADWADHIAADKSAWGNRSMEHGEPLDAEWGFPAVPAPISA